MTVTLVNQPPSEFVRFLREPGLETSRGPVALSSYVSTGGRSPRAAAVRALLENAVTRHTRALATGRASEGLAGLARVRTAVITDTGRPSSWRRLFTGQGEPAHLVQLWEYILRNQDYLLTLDSERRPLLTRYLRDVGNPIAAMVRDEIFGCDCLGFVGNYLCFAGFREHYPEYTAEQYVSRFHFETIGTLEAIQPLSVLLWTGTGTQHIAIVDRVHGVAGGLADVDICQSSTGGPQTNHHVKIQLYNGALSNFGSQAFRIADPGSDPAPVTGPMAMARHPNLQLVRPGT